jgi:hypothetical protein
VTSKLSALEAASLLASDDHGCLHFLEMYSAFQSMSSPLAGRERISQSAWSLAAFHSTCGKSVDSQRVSLIIVGTCRRRIHEVPSGKWKTDEDSESSISSLMMKGHSSGCPMYGTNTRSK